FLLLVKRKRAVNKSCLDAALTQTIYLVFHQSNQRRDDQRRSILHQCGQLIAERFAAASRHYHETIAAIEDCLNNIRLSFEERIKTEMFFQCISGELEFVH